VVGIVAFFLKIIKPLQQVSLPSASSQRLEYLAHPR